MKAGVLPVTEEDLQATEEFIPDGPERVEAGLLRSGHGRRIGKPPVKAVRLSGEGGADLLGA